MADDPKANKISSIGQLSSSLDPNSLNQEEKNDIHTASNDLLGESIRDMPPKCMQKEQCVVNKGDSSSYSCKITDTMPSTTLRAGNKNQLSPRVKLRKSVKSGLNYLPLITMIPKSDEVDPNDVNRRVSQKPRGNGHVQNEQLIKVSNPTIVQSRKNCQQKGHYDIDRPIPVMHNQITSSSNYNAMNSAQHRRNSAVSINSTKSNEQLTTNYDKTARKRQQGNVETLPKESNSRWKANPK